MLSTIIDVTSLSRFYSLISIANTISNCSKDDRYGPQAHLSIFQVSANALKFIQEELDLAIILSANWEKDQIWRHTGFVLLPRLRHP